MSGLAGWQWPSRRASASWSAAAADRWAPAPAADVLKGTEEAFAEQLQWRELPPGQPPLRWTEPSARVVFRHLPPVLRRSSSTCGTTPRR